MGKKNSSFPTGRFVREWLVHFSGTKPGRLKMALSEAWKTRQKISHSFSQGQATVIGVLGLCLIESQLLWVKAKKIPHQEWDNKLKYESWKPKCKVGYKFERTEKAGKWRSNNSCYIELTIYHVSRSLNILTHLLLQS